MTTFAEVLRERQYRAIVAAGTLSWLGDVIAKAAVTYLVFRQTGSVLLSAATFAIGYLAWVAGGPVLAALAERHDPRRVMILCDLVRMVAIALVAIPGLPVAAIVALLFAVSLFTPPFEAARSALLPRLLEGDRYVVAISLQTIIFQVAQLSGYLVSGALLLFSPRVGLLVNAVAFLASALLLRHGVRAHPPLAAAARTHLLKETAAGFRVVFGRPVLRSIALVVFAAVFFTILPEGLAAAWTAQLGGDVVAQGMLMASAPVGAVIGGFVVGRLVPPGLRERLVAPASVACPLVMVPALGNPPFAAVLVMSTLTMALGTGLVIACNGMFVKALPAEFRARAFGVMQGGLYISQGLAVALAGAVSARWAISDVVGWWSTGGVVLMGVLVFTLRGRTAVVTGEAPAA